MPVLLFSGLEPYWQAPSVVGWRQREMLYKSFFPPDYQVGQMLSSFPFNASGEPGLQHVQHHWGSTFQYPLIINGPFKGGGEDTDLIGAEAPATPKKMQITMLSCIFFINESKSKTYLTDSTPLYFRPGVKVIPGNSNQVVIKVINALICFHLWKSIQLTLWAYQDWTRERNQPALNAFLSPEISPGESGKVLDYK